MFVAPNDVDASYVTKLPYDAVNGNACRNVLGIFKLLLIILVWRLSDVVTLIAGQESDKTAVSVAWPPYTPGVNPNKLPSPVVMVTDGHCGLAWPLKNSYGAPLGILWFPLPVYKMTADLRTP